MTRILFLAANPRDTPRSRLDEEIRTIEERIRLAAMRHLFDIRNDCALRTRDLQRTLLQHKPEIVHFAGVGSPSGEIMLENHLGLSQPVTPKGLSELFAILKDNVQCVLMNTCYSRMQAQAIGGHIHQVIGWSGVVDRQAAISFAASFYQALGFGRSLNTAFHLASNQLTLEGLTKGAHPVRFGKDKTTLNGGSSPADTRYLQKSIFGRNQRTADRKRPVLDVAEFASSKRFVTSRQLTDESSRIDMLRSALLTRLNEGEPSDRMETARQLGSLSDPAAVPILETRWPLEFDPAVRHWLAVALGRIGGEEAKEALKRLKQCEVDPLAQAGINEALSCA
jgi:hypothetical protein